MADGRIRTARRALGTALLGTAALLAAGCCSLGPEPPSELDRDTPERAFAFVRAAYAEDRLRDQYFSLHPDFVERHGISEQKYRIAHTLSPGSFEEVAVLLGAAELAGLEPLQAPVATSRGPRRAVRARLTVPGGGRGVFLLVDEPAYFVRTDDPDLPEKRGGAAGMAGGLRIEDGRLRVELDLPLGAVAPFDGARIDRLEVHHDWLVYAIERLDGIDVDRLMEEVAAAEETQTP